MTTITFDSLDYFEKLKDAGFTEKQAKVQASVLQTALNMHDETSRKELATRGDVQDVRNELKEEIQDVRNELKDTKHEILKWMIATMVAQTALIVAVIAFLK